MPASCSSIACMGRFFVASWQLLCEQHGEAARAVPGDGERDEGGEGLVTLSLDCCQKSRIGWNGLTMVRLAEKTAASQS